MNSVFVLQYDHQYGNDVSVYSSEEAAYRNAAGLVAEYAEEMVTDTETLEKIAAALRDGLYARAMKLFNEADHDEMITVTQTPVLSIDQVITDAQMIAILDEALQRRKGV